MDKSERIFGDSLFKRFQDKIPTLKPGQSSPNVKKRNRFVSLRDYKENLEKTHLPLLNVTQRRRLNKISLDLTASTSVFNKSSLKNHSVIQNNTISSAAVSPFLNDNKSNENAFKQYILTTDTAGDDEYVQEDLEKNVNTLISFYHTVGNKTRVKGQSLDQNLTKQEVFKKFDISERIDKKEQNTITNIIEHNNFHKTKVSSQSIVINDQYFKSPFKSLKKVKVNKEIHDKVIDFFSQRQTKMYLENYNKAFLQSIKLQQMPEIKKSDLTKLSINSQMAQSITFTNNGGANRRDSTVATTSFVNPSTSSKRISNRLRVSREAIFINSLLFQGINIFTKNKPKSRSQPATVILDSIMIVFGGLNGSGQDDLWYCDLRDRFTWFKIKPYGRGAPIGRFGHSAVMYRKEIYFYGGIACENTAPEEDILIFSVSDNKWTFEKTSNKTRMNYRRNHIAHVVGHSMLVFGGVDIFDHFLGDLWSLDLITMDWHEVEEKGPKIGKLAYMASALVISSERAKQPNLSIYKFGDIQGRRKKIRWEGIYIFGGIDSELNIKGDLNILKLGIKPIETVTPRTYGKSPEPRTNATLNYHETLNILILFGGQNNKLGVIFNDLYMFDLDSFSWYSVTVYDDPAVPRYDHSAVIYDNMIIIFGGMGNNHVLGSDLYALNMDFGENKHTKENLLSKFEVHQKHFKSLGKVKNTELN